MAADKEAYRAFIKMLASDPRALDISELEAKAKEQGSQRDKEARDSLKALTSAGDKGAQILAKAIKALDAEKNPQPEPAQQENNDNEILERANKLIDWLRDNGYLDQEEPPTA